MSELQTEAAEPPVLAEEAPERPAGFRLSWLWEPRWRGALVLGAVAVLVFATSLLNGFAYDDAAIIQGDVRVKSFQLLQILRKPYWVNSPDLAIYRPLTTISFAIDWFISRGTPWFFHAVNALEHGVASALVFLLLAEMFAPAAAFVAALVFAVHPVHVEAVANVVGRAEVLSAVFYLGALLCWARASTFTAGRVAAVTGLYVLALLTKESSATLPAALVLLDAALGRWTLRPGSMRDYARRVLPAMAACTAVLGGFLYLRYVVLGRLAPGVVDPIFDLPMTAGGRIMTALQTWPVYARLVFFPRILLADYSPRVIMPVAEWTILGLVGLGLLLGLLVVGADALWRGRGRTALGTLWFPLTMLPVANLLFPIGIIVAERTLYLPLMAVCFAVAALVERAPAFPSQGRRALVGAGALALVLLTVRTETRIPVWNTTDEVFYALSADRPDSFRAAWHLARIARRLGKPELEMRRYRKAVALWPFRRYLVTEALQEAVRLKRYTDARDLGRFAVGRWPYSVAIRQGVATAALALGDTAAARDATRAGLKISPRDTALLRLWKSMGGGDAR